MPIILRSSTRIWLVAGAAFACLALAFGLLGWTVEWLWMGQLGFRQVFWEIRLTQVGLFIAALVPTFLYFWANAVALRRVIADAEMPGGPWAAPVVPAQVPDWAKGAAVILLPLLAALVVAVAFSGMWDDFLRFRFAQPFGDVEPVLGRDAGFYVFILPFLDDIQNALVGITAIGIGAHFLVYHQYGLLRAWRAQRDAIRQRMLKNVAANLILFVLAWGWGYYLDRFDLLHESSGTVFGPGYADVTVKLPALAVMVGASVALIAVIVAATIRNKVLWPVLGIGSYVLIAAVGLMVVPALFEQFVVKPNELALETPYLRNNIRFTRLGFGLDKVDARSYPAVTALTLDRIRANPDTLDNIRLWDWRPLRQTYQQLQEIRTYYHFYHIDVDRYVLDGRLRQVLLSARELAPHLPSQTDTWVNRVLQYTHGYGLVMSLAAHEDTSGEGMPKLVVKDVPPVATGGIKIEQPAIYYGDEPKGYRIVDTKIGEFDYPRGDANVYTHYAGKGGVPLSSWWRRLLFAWNRFDVNILISSYITPHSRIQLWQGVAERVSKIAPFLKLDSDPYLVVSGGRLYWVQDAYTVADTFPYSETTDTGINYIRNSVKVIVNAYDGSVTFYVADPTDPILKAYEAAFPGLFKPLSTISPDLKAHLRYPRDMFSVQVAKYMRYHMTVPQVFYNNEDLWTLPKEKYAGRLSSMQPYYILMRLPDERRLQFLLMIPLTPQNRDNMIAWMAARCDFPNYGQLVVYKFPKEKLVYGPLQIEALIDQNTTISRQISLWDQRGSRVLRGNMMVIPIDHSILYVEPAYLIAETGEVPQLKRVIVAYGGRVAMERTLDEALGAVFGQGPTTTGSALAAVVGKAPAATTSTLPTGAMERARQALARADDAMKRGDWPAFGSAMEALKKALGDGGGAKP